MCLCLCPSPVPSRSTRKKLKPPQVMRVGTTRTAWVNFKEICNMMKRTPDHVQSFFLNELGTTGVYRRRWRMSLVTCDPDLSVMNPNPKPHLTTAAYRS